MTGPFIIRPGEGRLLDLGNFEAVVLADEPATSGAFTVLQTQGEPPGFGPPLHVHRNAAEAFYVLEGTYLMYVEERQDIQLDAPCEPFDDLRGQFSAHKVAHQVTAWWRPSPDLLEKGL